MVTKHPRITVCVTSYNHKRFITACIDSLLNQTYDHVDIFVIDDCSTDGSLDILRAYGDRIHLTIHSKNLGLPAYCDMVNSVMRKATGEFFYRLDSDDFIELDYFERMISVYRQDNSLDWICGGLNIVDEFGTITDSWDYNNWPTDPHDAIARGWQSCSVLMPHNGIIRTRFLQDNKLCWQHFPYGWGCDVEFTIRAMLCQPRIKLLPEPGFNWRTHGSNNSCDVSRRINLVLAVKKYYLENISEEIYLTHPALAALAKGTDEYHAARDFLVAADLYAARVNFRIPAMFESTDTAAEIEKHLYLFDEAIRMYAERSLAASSRHHLEIAALYARLEGEKQLIEGRHSLTLGDFRFAASKFESVLKTDAQSVRALNGLTEASFGLAKYDSASVYSSRVLGIAPADPTALNNAGVIMHARGDFLAAEEALQSSLKTSPTVVATHSNLLALYASLSAGNLLSETQKARLLSSTHWLARQPSPPEKQPLKQLSDNLYTESLNKYTNRYQSDTARVLLHQPSNGALKYLMQAWSETLTYMGVTTELLSWGEDVRTKFDKFRPTTFITVADPAFYSQLDTSFIKKYRAERNLSIGQVTTLEHRIEPVDFYITFHLDPDRDKRFSALDRPLISLPFAINPLRHRMRAAHQVWDYFFVGSNSYRKADRTKSFLEPLLMRYSGILAGSNWKTGIGEIQIEQAAEFYGFAAICPNYHLNEQIDDFNEVNERAFIIPACGAFQIVDNPAAIKELFAPDEMAVADSPEEYLDMFEHFLKHPTERDSYIEKGMRRVWKEYTLFSVMARLCEFLGCKEHSSPTPISETAAADSIRSASLTP